MGVLNNNDYGAVVTDSPFFLSLTNLVAWNQKNPPQTQRTESEAGLD
jgi:hypothetical protein